MGLKRMEREEGEGSFGERAGVWIEERGRRYIGGGG